MFQLRPAFCQATRCPRNTSRLFKTAQHLQFHTQTRGTPRPMSWNQLSLKARRLAAIHDPNILPFVRVSASMSSIRGHAGHSHSHSHKHDNVYLTSANKKDAGVRITRIGLFVNLGMAVGKGVGGYLFHSQALIADAFHALTDLVSDFMTLATISWSLKPPTARFPTGYGKIESLGALGVSGLLLFGGMGMGLNSLDALYTQFFMEAVHEDHHHGLFSFLGHNHSHGASLPNINAAWLAGGSILVKEWLYRATMKIAKERKSSVLASNAIHHRIDSLTSIVALATIGGAHIFTDASWLDPVGGLLISLMVIRAGWYNTSNSLLELADISVDDEVKNSVRRSATKAIKGDDKSGLSGLSGGSEIEIKDVQGVKSGQNYLIDIELVVPGMWAVQQTNAVEAAVRERVGSKVRGVRKVRVKFTAAESSSGDFAGEFIGADVSPRSSPEPEAENENHDHDHDEHHHSNGHTHTKTSGQKKTK